jgi:hypothetical protein
MKLTIANISTQITPEQLHAAVAAINRQVKEHFEPEWGKGATLTATAVKLTGKKAPIQRDTDAVIYIGDSVQDSTAGVQGALGYHSDNHKKIPYGFIYLDVCSKYKEEWTCTLSHEVLELLGDPDAALTVTGPAPKTKAKAAAVKAKAVAAKAAPLKSGMVYYDLEVCDPTQGDTYKIDGIVVSNFVGRSYFKLSGGTGKTNHMGLPLTAFGVRPGGYVQYEDGNTTHQINGKKVTETHLAAKKLMIHGRRNERRRLRLAAKK